MKQKETPTPSRLRGRGVEVSKTLSCCYLLFLGFFCFTEVSGCDRIKTLLQAGYEGIIWHGFCTVKADRGYLSDIFFRENEVEGLWRSI